MGESVRGRPDDSDPRGDVLAFCAYEGGQSSGNSHRRQVRRHHRCPRRRSQIYRPAAECWNGHKTRDSVQVMQRPPNRSAPPVLFAHGTSEWIRRVNEKHKQLASLNLSSEQKGRLEKWSEIEFIHSTLALEGFDLVRERIAEAIYSEAQVGADYSETATLLISLRKVTALAGAKGKRAELTTDLLRDIHSVPGAEFRKTPAASDF